MNLPTIDQLKASGRHVGQLASGIVIGAVSLKLISGGDAASLQASFDQISHGAAEIAAGVAAIVSTVLAIYSALSANPMVQFVKGLLAVSKDPAKVAEFKATATIEQKAELIKTTDRLDEVRGVPLAPTNAGAQIADLVPSPTVNVAK